MPSNCGPEQTLPSLSSFGQCVSYFSVAVIKHHDQGAYERMHLIWGSWFQRVPVHGSHSGQHSSGQADMVLEQ